MAKFIPEEYLAVRGVVKCSCGVTVYEQEITLLNTAKVLPSVEAKPESPSSEVWS